MHLEPGGGPAVVAPPQVVDQTVGGQELPRVEDKGCEEGALLAPAQPNRAVSTDGFQRAQDAEFERHRGDSTVP